MLTLILKILAIVAELARRPGYHDLMDQCKECAEEAEKLKE